MQTPNLVLASSSPYRRELLERLRLPFAAITPNVDESPLPGESARQLVLRLSLAKARAVAKRRPDAVVIGSDQAATFNGRILGKPGSARNAVDQLREFAGQRVYFLTGLAVVRAASQRAATHLDVTSVRFRRASVNELRRYVEADSPLDCAGGIRIEGLGPLLLNSIETEDPSAAIGLPLIKLGQLLRAEGINPLR